MTEEQQIPQNEVAPAVDAVAQEPEIAVDAQVNAEPAAPVADEAAAPVAEAKSVETDAAVVAPEVAEAKSEATAPTTETRAEHGAPAHTAVFSRFFKGSSRKHAFSPGEIVAGRILEVRDGVIVLDLFGKAQALLDEREPKEPPIVTAEQSAAHENAEAASEEAAHEEAMDASAEEHHDEPAITESVAGAEAPAESAAQEVSETAAASAPEAAVQAAPEVDFSLLERPAATEGEEALELGSIFRGRIVSIADSGHIAIVNRLIDKAAVRKALRAARDKNHRVQGLVYGFNRGGFDVLVGGVRTFCPASGMSLDPIEDPNAFVGQMLSFYFPQRKGNKRNIVVSRRRILEKEALAHAKERLGELTVGQVLPGKVTEIRDFGVIVQIGDGLDGLVHVSELSWVRGTKTEDIVKVGDEVQVKVIRIEAAQRRDRAGRISLSLRQTQTDPWDALGDTIKEGRVVKGTIVTVTDFGAFLSLADGVEGLLHISEISHIDPKKAKSLVNVGDTLDVLIERIDRRNRKISLSKLSETDAKAIAEGKVEAGQGVKSVRQGAYVNAVVTRIDRQGLEVQIEGVLGRRGRGFVPSKEVGEKDNSEHYKGPSVGSTIEVKVIGEERDGTLRCSMRARQRDDERKAVKDYRKEVSKQGLGTFGDLLKAKLGNIQGS